jgi:hypothetical protein
MGKSVPNRSKSMADVLLLLTFNPHQRSKSKITFKSACAPPGLPEIVRKVTSRLHCVLSRPLRRRDSLRPSCLLCSRASFGIAILAGSQALLGAARDGAGGSVGGDDTKVASCGSVPFVLHRWAPQDLRFRVASSIDMYNNDVGKRFMK